MALADQTLQFFPVSARVSVLRARGLRIKGKAGTNDAYTTLQVGRETFRTPVSEKLAEPVWGSSDAEFIFTLPPEIQPDKVPLQARVFHRVPLGADKLLGLAVINVHELRQNSARENPQWFKLLNKTGKADKERGEVLLDIQFLKSSMSVSMMDLSEKSRLGKFKDKLRGKKKDGLSDSASAILPSASQVLTDSEGELDGETESETTKKKKKNKLKSLFVPKSNMKRNSLSQSLSSLRSLPDNSSISSSTSSGLNVESSEGKKKKKFSFLTHKRNGSTDSRTSNHSDVTLSATNQNPPPQIDICINGSHVYKEETQSEKMQDMEEEEEEEAENEEEEEKWRREEELQERLEEEKRREAKEERKRKEKEEQRRQEEEEKERISRERQKEENRRRIEEEEKERVRMTREKDEQRKKMAEEKERIRMEREKEEERIRMEREKEEERIRMEREKEEERIRMEREKEEERIRMEEEEEKERFRIEREREQRRLEEKEKERIRMERDLEEQGRWMEEEGKERMRMEREKEEKRRVEEEEKEGQRREKGEQRRKLEEEKEGQQREKEEQRRKLEEEGIRKREKEEQIRRFEEERKRREEKEAEELRIKMAKENDRKKAGEGEKLRIAEEERKKRAERERWMAEEEKRIEMERLSDEKKAREEEERRMASEKEKQWKEEERVREERERKRAEMEMKRREEEQERRNMEMEERQKKEKQMREEQERLKKENIFDESVFSQSTDFTRSARLSNVKPRVSVSATVSQASMASTKPFLDDELYAIGLEERTVKKKPAPSPPQFVGPDVRSTVVSKELSHSKEVSKRQAPQPPGMLKMSREVTDKNHDSSIAQAGLDQEARKEKHQESTVLSVSQDDTQVNTNLFTCDEPMPVKRNKRPAPMPGSGKSVSEDKPRSNGKILPEGTVHHDEKASASNGKDNQPNWKLLREPNNIAVEDVKSDLTDYRSRTEEHVEDSTKPNAPSGVNRDVFSEPLVSRTDGPLSMESSEKKTQVSLPPNKPKRSGDSSMLHQQASLLNKTNFKQTQANHTNQKDQDNASVSSSTFSPLADKSQVVKRYDSETGEASSKSGSRTLPWAKVVSSDAGEVREHVAPTPVIRPHAVKPLSAVEKRPETYESRVTDSTQPKTKAVEAVMKGPYSQLTQAELISLALQQQEQILQRNARIQELELYIDNLLVRVIEEKPSILMSLNKSI